MQSLAANDKNVTQLNQRVDALATRYQELFAQSDELNKKQEALESLQTRLDQVDQLSKRTTSQLDALNQSRSDLEALRKEIADFHTSYAEAAQLRDKLGIRSRGARELHGARHARSTCARPRSKRRWTPSSPSSASSTKARRRPRASASWRASSTARSIASPPGCSSSNRSTRAINGLNGVLAEVEQQAERPACAARRGRDDQDPD